MTTREQADKAANYFGQNLRTARTHAKLSQEALAERAGVRQMTISELETGQHDPQWRTALALSLALGISVGKLAGE